MLLTNADHNKRYLERNQPIGLLSPSIHPTNDDYCRDDAYPRCPPQAFPPTPCYCRDHGILL